MRTLPAGSRYGIVQALCQTLETAMRWRMISENPAKLAGRNPEPRREQVDPFEHAESTTSPLNSAPTARSSSSPPKPAYGPRNGSLSSERDIDRPGAAVGVEPTYADGRVKTYGKTMAARRRVPLSTRAQAALDEMPARLDTPLVLPHPRGTT
jgi:hypothetical protein